MLLKNIHNYTFKFNKFSLYILFDFETAQPTECQISDSRVTGNASFLLRAPTMSVAD